MHCLMTDNELVLRDCGYYYEQLRGTGRFKWSKTDKAMHGALCLETLQALASVVNLSEDLAAVRDVLQHKADRIQAERDNPDPVPLLRYPIKNAELMKHQVRGANMAALTFDLV